MQSRVVRFTSRNPVVVALVLALLLAVLAVVVTVGLAVGAGLAAVGGVALLARRARRGSVGPVERRGLDPGQEVFAPEPGDASRRLPPGPPAA